MVKKFAPRVSKKNRKVISLAKTLDKELFKVTDEKLLKGAKLSEIYLEDIRVKEQVRTKFNDHSLKELADNIRTNGLIQPLVLHLKDEVYTLICGERRYRAMSLIKMKKCPCFVLQNKNEEELMAIQFSENSSREALHYIDKADGIYHYQKATKASEREITQALGITKSDVHRSLMIARLPLRVKTAAKKYDIEKYVLLEFYALPKGIFKEQIENKILSGELSKRSQLKRAINTGNVALKRKKTTRSRTSRLPNEVSANLLFKAISTKVKGSDIDEVTRRRLKSILEETREMIDL